MLTFLVIHAGLHPGKMCGFDTDIHIPLIIRGPGVQRKHISQMVTSHTDIAPTILGLAGQTRDDFDGTAIPIHDPTIASPSSQEHINIEYWGNVIPEGIWGRYGNVLDPTLGSDALARNNTYKGLRLVAADYSLYYSVWCTGEKEYYDVKVGIELTQSHIILCLNS